jgi:hypothetical protein
MIAEWDSDWKSPLAPRAKELWLDYREKWTALLRDPQRYEPSAVF